jgi:hypothetical protein
MDVYDLYTMSKRNGSHQSYNEFRGVVRDIDGVEFLSLGAILVIDPRDLSLDDLSSGSIGQYSFQASVTAGALKSIKPFGTTVNLACQLNIICSFGGVLVTQQGSSASTLLSPGMYCSFAHSSHALPAVVVVRRHVGTPKLPLALASHGPGLRKVSCRSCECARGIWLRSPCAGSRPAGSACTGTQPSEAAHLRGLRAPSRLLLEKEARQEEPAFVR